MNQSLLGRLRIAPAVWRNFPLNGSSGEVARDPCKNFHLRHCSVSQHKHRTSFPVSLGLSGADARTFQAHVGIRFTQQGISRQFLQTCSARGGGGTGGGGGVSSALLSPPAGFILNEKGEVVLMAPEAKRLLPLQDEASGRSLECVIRRTFLASDGTQFFLLYPLDVPVIIYRADSNGALVEIEDEEVLDAFPAASYALARRNFHLVLSGYVLTVRGAVCFSQEDVTGMNVEYGMGIGGNLSEGVEIASFTHKAQKYIVYTPFDPLLFVAFRDPSSGVLRVAEDEEQLDDPKLVQAIEEEQDYQRLVNEEEEMAQLMRTAHHAQ